ncbi:hypothetical protein OKW37_003409 [Paraburkholderia sp. MM5482-R2]
MSQPEKLVYCAAWPALTVWTCWSKPIYWPLESLNTLGAHSA